MLLSTPCVVATSALCASATLAYQHVEKRTHDVATVHCAHNEYNDCILAHLSDLLAPRKTPLWAPLFNGNLQTLYAVRWRTIPELDFQRETLSTPDGGTVAIDWVHAPSTATTTMTTTSSMETTETIATTGSVKERRSIVVVLVPGYGNCSKVCYVRILARACLQRGWDVAVYVPRACGGLKLSTPRLFLPGDADDLTVAINHVAHSRPGCRLGAVGFSLGGNKLLKYLGTRGSATPLRAAITVSQGYDALGTAEYFRANPFYSRYFCEKMKTLLREYREHFEGREDIDIERLLSPQMQSIEEFDREFSAPVAGYANVESYYSDNSSVHSMEGVAIPTLLLNAMDDPLVPEHLVPVERIKANVNLILLTTRLGTHLGFSEAAKSGWLHPEDENWADKVAIRYLEATLDNCRHIK